MKEVVLISILLAEACLAVFLFKKYLFKKRYIRTKDFIGREYKINNPERRIITVGDTVIVHPTETSISRLPFEAKIILKKIDWVTVKESRHYTQFVVIPSLELCTFVKGGYAAVMNEYLFSRLEPKPKKGFVSAEKFATQQSKFRVKPEDCKQHKVVGFDGISDLCAECGTRIPFSQRTLPLEDYFSKEYVVSYKPQNSFINP